MKTLIVSGSPFSFPQEGDAPKWGTEVTDWATAITDAVAGLAGTYDINNLAYTIANSQTSFSDINNFSFDPVAVKAVQITYACSRSSSVSSLIETGTLYAVYDSSLPASSKWFFSRYQAGSANVQFNISDLGQVQVKVGASIAGTGYVGNLRLNARAFEV